MNGFDDFLREHYTFLTSLIEFIAAFTGIILYKKYKHSNVKYIIYFLIYVYFVDLIGGYPSFLKEHGYFHLIEGTLIEQNYWWYTIFWWLGFSSVMFYVNYLVVSTKNSKKILKYAYYLYLLQVVLFMMFRFDKLFVPNQFISIVSLWIILLSIIIYFFDILNSEQIISFYRSMYFYFNSIFFVWLLIIMPLEFFEEYFVEDDWNYVIFRWKIQLILNSFLYLSLAASLVFCNPDKNTLIDNS